MKMLLHSIKSEGPLPRKFNNPFCYEPDGLCLEAAWEVRSYVDNCEELRADAAKGKMFGVLIVETEDGETGYLAAFSGQLAGRGTLPFFVPPVFDGSLPGGYFKVHEAEISLINRRIDDISESDAYRRALSDLCRCAEDCRRAEDGFKERMARAKARRDAVRSSAGGVTAEMAAQLVRESQFMKAELRRIRQRNRGRMDAFRKTTDVFADEIARLKVRRKQLSDSLQQWLFSRYVMLNSRGERRSLCEIFAETPQRVPPSGAGDCCAPKLLQHAFLHGMRPVSMAEFWYGASPRTEVRSDGTFYPACRGKCLPILTFMLQGMSVEAERHEHAVSQPLEVVYEDRWITVVNKPAGMKSVPGRQSRLSVQSLLEDRAAGGMAPRLVHRLDMDTSGLLIAANDAATHKALQWQFARREVIKRYVALLDGAPDCAPSGTISLPLCADPLDRPYQKVDAEKGKSAVTDYTIISETGRRTRIELTPRTGRTHQLRLHCAHAAGLGTPILGDRLYGRRLDRMYLHAEAVTFSHPATGKTVTFERKAPF